MTSVIFKFRGSLGGPLGSCMVVGGCSRPSVVCVRTGYTDISTSRGGWRKVTEAREGCLACTDGQQSLHGQDGRCRRTAQRTTAARDSNSRPTRETKKQQQQQQKPARPRTPAPSRGKDEEDFLFPQKGPPKKRLGEARGGKLTPPVTVRKSEPAA